MSEEVKFSYVFKKIGDVFTIPVIATNDWEALKELEKQILPGELPTDFDMVEKNEMG